jgi:WD40 repeat protein
LKGNQRTPEPNPPVAAVPATIVTRPTPRPEEPVGLSREFRGHTRRVNGVAMSGDGRTALSGGQDRTVRLWNVATGKEVRRVAHDGPVEAVAMSGDGRYGLSGSDDKTVRLWDFRPEHDVGMRRLEGHAGAIFTVAFGQGDQLALSGSADKTIRVWDVATGQSSGLPLRHEGAVVAMATTGGDSVLAGCDDGTLWLWDLKSRQRVRRMKAPGRVLCVACSPFGNRAISGHADGVLVVWDLDLGAEMGRLVGHGDLVRCAAILPDGRRALAGSQFGHMVLWDLETQAALYRSPLAASLSEQAGQLGVAVLADDRHALSADTDAMVCLWTLPAIDTTSEDPQQRAGP